MKKVLLSAAVALSLVATLVPTAAVVAESSSDANSAVSSEESSSKKSHSEADKADWGKRSTPVPLGEAKEITYKEYFDSNREEVTIKLSLTEVIKGQEAVDKLVAYNSFNKKDIDKVDAAYDVSLIKVKLEYIKGNEDEALKTPYRPKVFDEKGKEIKADLFVMLKDTDEFAGVELYPGSEHEGYIAVVVPKDGKFTIAYEFGKPVFFATEKE